ncbi:MAG: DUF420 domain-containing protein [Candidatus Poribacteria bacterium]|nr:DUF420 domain-containing protein [Candidatus Poribacteria bacterium]
MPTAETIPQWVLFLPNVNATLNAISAALLITGYLLIRRRKIPQHRAAMIGAFVASSLFLATYLTYHFYPGVGSVRFVEPSWARPIYLVVLIPHVLLAVTVVPLALITLSLAWRGNFKTHRRFARIALPVWLYVSVTGVIVYLMLYVIFPQPMGPQTP